MFRSTFSMGRGVPLLSIRAHGSSGEGSAAQAVADASPHFPGDAAGEKTLSWCAFLGFWSYGLEEGAFSVRRRRPAAAYRPYGRVRALPWFSFGLTPSKGKVAVFLKESA